MGGQACVLYGAAEFSRDCDIAIVCDPQNIGRLRSALAELQAEQIAVPPFETENLVRGHAVHFRCKAPQVENLRIDVMAKMRGVAHFAELWARRTTVEDDSGTRIEVMALPDLIAAKRTQRDKDWPMLRRLVEAHYAEHALRSTVEDVRFWLTNLRTPTLLIQLAAKHPDSAANLVRTRPLLETAIAGDMDQLATALSNEELNERKADQEYWRPLKTELESMRRERRNQ
jgi:hypothetical protein